MNQEKTTIAYGCYPGAPCLTRAETGMLHGYTCPNHRADPGWLDGFQEKEDGDLAKPHSF